MSFGLIFFLERMLSRGGTSNEQPRLSQRLVKSKHAAIKTKNNNKNKQKLLMYTTTWMNLKIMMLSERARPLQKEEYDAIYIKL